MTKDVKELRAERSYHIHRIAELEKEINKRPHGDWAKARQYAIENVSKATQDAINELREVQRRADDLAFRVNDLVEQGKRLQIMSVDEYREYTVNRKKKG